MEWSCMAGGMPPFLLWATTGVLAAFRGLRVGTRALGRALLLPAGSRRGGHPLGIALPTVLTWFGINLFPATELMWPHEGGERSA